LERIGIGFNPSITSEESAEYAQMAEHSGYDSFWVHEQPFIRDAISLLCSGITATTRIKIGSGCISVVTRHPLLAASTFVSLNSMSHDRVVMGVGLGGFPWLPKIGVKVFPVAETHPMKRITEYLTIVKALLNGDSVTLHGEFFEVNDIKLDTKPAVPPRLYLAAFGARLLEMAPNLVQGVIISPALMTPRVTNQKVQRIHGRDTIDIASYVLTTVSKDLARAKQLMKSYYFLIYQVAEVIRPEVLEPYDVHENDLVEVKKAWQKKDLVAAGKTMPDEILDALTLTGKTDHCLDRLREYRKAGVQLPIIMPIGDIKSTIEAFRKT
jgi:5,10-methylenetetrahydromethanopterin reductase